MRAPHMRAVFALLLPPALVLAAAPARAEKADRDKPALIEFDKNITDELKQTSIYTGKVRLTKGTLILTGDRMEVRVDPERYHSAVITAADGQLATYRQRRDPQQPGIEEFVEGYAERIEYDERTETFKFIRRALWKRLENEQPRGEVAGDLIIYDSRNRTTSVDGKPGTDDGRGRAIVAPRTAEAAAAPAAPVPLKPAAKPAPETKK